MSNFLAITYAFMLAYCPYYNMSMGKEAWEDKSDATHVEFQLGLDICGCVNLYAGEETYQVSKEGLTSWQPFTQSYWLGAEYHKDFNDKLMLKAGVRHICQHPVSCWSVQLSKYNKATTELYLGIEGRFDIF